MFEADPHNFGRRVERIARASGALYQKPRPVYWEWLFFGRTSPLADIFDRPDAVGSRLRNFLFNLDVEIIGSTGVSLEVSQSKTESTQTHVYAFGVLLAYCYIFGIRDLHRGNLVKTKTHLQVVDAEIVLAKLLLPHETLLLPYKDISFDSCGARAIFDYAEAIRLDDFQKILRGFCDMFDCVLERRDDLLEVFEAEANRTRDIPIRHILRDTVHYRNWKVATPTNSFFSSEINQLNRGDIPYFFKFLSKSDLFVQTSAEGHTSKVEFPDVFKRGVEREAISPVELLAKERLEKNLLPAGALFLAKKLLPPTFLGEVEMNRSSIIVFAGEIKFACDGQMFSAIRN